MPKNNELANSVQAASTLSHETGNSENQVLLSETPITQLSDLRVSASTAKYIHVMDKVSDLWNLVYDTIADNYGKEQVDGIFSRDFASSFDGLNKAIADHFITSINEVHGIKGNERII